MSDYQIFSIVGGFIIVMLGWLKADIQRNIKLNDKIWTSLDVLTKEFHILYGEHKKNHE